MHILQTVFAMCLLLPTLGRTGQWTTGPHHVHMSMWGCDDLFSSQHCLCPRLPRQSKLCFWSKISHCSISCSVSVKYNICAILSFFVLHLFFFHSYPGCVCLRNKLLPPTLITFIFFLSIPVSPPPALIQTFTNALQILSLMKASQWTGHL